MAKTEELDTESPEAQMDESIIEKLVGLFQSNSVAVDYGTDPQEWVEANLPEGTEAGDVARCMPEATARLGGPYQANAARYNASHGAAGEAATHTVVNEISYTYNTIYQQNAFIHAEEGSQVVNIQGDGNTVDQTQIDLEFGAEHPEDYEDDEGYEDGEETPVEETDQDPELPEDTDGEDTEGEDTETEDGWEDPVDPPVEDPGPDPLDPQDGWEDPSPDPVPDPVDPPQSTELPEGAEAF